MTALFEKVYVHVMNDYPPIMQFTVFFFSLFYRATVFRYFPSVLMWILFLSHLLASQWTQAHSHHTG